MRGLVRIDGLEVGLSNSLCMVLESMQLVDISNMVARIPTVYADPSLYMVFARGLTPTDNYAFGMRAEVGKGFVDLITNHLKVMIYIYRKILSTDKASGYGMNIYNDKGELFYSSSKRPLRIKSVLEFTPTAVLQSMVSNDRTQTYTENNSMVLCSNILAISNDDFIRFLSVVGQHPNGTIRVSGLLFSGGPGVGSGSTIYSQQIITAYPPDLM